MGGEAADGEPEQQNIQAAGSNNVHRKAGSSQQAAMESELKQLHRSQHSQDQNQHISKKQLNKLIST